MACLSYRLSSGPARCLMSTWASASRCLHRLTDGDWSKRLHSSSQSSLALAFQTAGYFYVHLVSPFTFFVKWSCVCHEHVNASHVNSNYPASSGSTNQVRRLLRLKKRADARRTRTYDVCLFGFMFVLWIKCYVSSHTLLYCFYGLYCLIIITDRVYIVRFEITAES